MKVKDILEAMIRDREKANTSMRADGLEELKRLSVRLDALLGDAHPGLMTWRKSLSDVLSRLGEFSGK